MSKNIKDSDLDMMDYLDKLGTSYQLLLTKTDKISRSKLDLIFENTYAEISNHSACYIDIINTSSKKDLGIDKLRSSILSVVS